MQLLQFNKDTEDESEFRLHTITLRDARTKPPLGHILNYPVLLNGPYSDYNIQNSRSRGTLIGGPLAVTRGDYCVINTGISSLVGSPLIVNGEFYVSRNPIKDFIGGPLYVQWNFYCTSNNITSFEGFPLFVGGDINMIECTYRGIPMSDIPIDQLKQLILDQGCQFEGWIHVDNERL